MLNNIENLKITSVNKRTTKNRTTPIKYESNAFILRLSGGVRYEVGGSYYDVNAGEVIFMPEGMCESLITLTDEPSWYVSLRFEADTEDAKPEIYSLEGFTDAEELENNLADLWNFGGKAEHYKCYSVLYNLMAYAENQKNLNYADKKKTNIIAPAVSYLKKHIYDCNLKIETLISLCGISGTYFQNIFQANYGVSPQKYILGKRLSHAKAIIDSGDFDTVSEIAASVGYSDPLYFSRAFKKKYGLSPMGYVKR